MSELDHENDLQRLVAVYLSALCEEIAASSQTFHWIPILVRDGQMAKDFKAYGWHHVLGMKAIDAKEKRFKQSADGRHIHRDGRDAREAKNQVGVSVNTVKEACAFVPLKYDSKVKIGSRET